VGVLSLLQGNATHTWPVGVSSDDVCSLFLSRSLRLCVICLSLFFPICFPFHYPDPLSQSVLFDIPAISVALITCLPPPHRLIPLSILSFPLFFPPLSRPLPVINYSVNVKRFFLTYLSWVDLLFSCSPADGAILALSPSLHLRLPRVSREVFFLKSSPPLPPHSRSSIQDPVCLACRTNRGATPRFLRMPFPWDFTMHLEALSPLGYFSLSFFPPRLCVYLLLLLSPILSFPLRPSLQLPRQKKPVGCVSLPPSSPVFPLFQPSTLPPTCDCFSFSLNPITFLPSY